MLKDFHYIIRSWVKAFIYPKPFIGIFFLPKYFYLLFRFNKISKDRKPLISDLQPCLGDWSPSTPFDPHYLYQGAWLARKLKLEDKNEHLDIASSVYTISVISAFAKTTFIDYRPLDVSLVGLNSIQGDILKLPFLDNSVQSVSCLHVLEHIGLGRYGDVLDPFGDIKAMHELQRILSNNGSLFVSLPIGRERTCFNAHRIYNPNSVVNIFKGLKLKEFSIIDDDGAFHENQTLNSQYQFDYGCGLFHFVK